MKKPKRIVIRRTRGVYRDPSQIAPEVEPPSRFDWAGTLYLAGTCLMIYGLLRFVIELDRLDIALKRLFR
jgi:hypothetical protein